MRISVTTIESYRLWAQPEQEWMKESELIDTIKGVFKPNAKMLVGLAFGRALEKPQKYLKEGRYRVPVKNAEGEWVVYWFEEEELAPALESYDRQGVSEVKGTRRYGDVTVVTKLDHIVGTQIKETKGKLSSSFSIERYQDSYQWRFELDLFPEARMLTYNVFMLEELDRPGEIGIKDCQTFNFFPYANLHADCADLVDDFVQYVEMRGLTEYLQEKTYA